MLFDTRETGEALGVEGTTWQQPGAAVARHRPPHDFLTLPRCGRSVPVVAELAWRAEQDLADLVATHFRAGPLAAADVPSFTGAGDAMGHAFFAWAKRQSERWQRLNFQFVLCDVATVQEAIAYQYEQQDFEAESALYLGVETNEESLWTINARAWGLLQTHPRLLSSALILISRASFPTLWIRTPDEFLGVFAQWFWEGDTDTSDDEAREALVDRFGDDEVELARYLPSVARRELCPTGMEIGRFKSRGRWVHEHALGVRALRRMQRFETGWTQSLCAELEQLSLLLAKAGKRALFNWSAQCEVVYPAASIAATDSDHVGQLLDGHYDHFNSGGDGSTFHGFVGFASDSDAIHAQYASWRLGITILQHVDRVLTLITE